MRERWDNVLNINCKSRGKKENRDMFAKLKFMFRKLPYPQTND